RTIPIISNNNPDRLPNFHNRNIPPEYQLKQIIGIPGTSILDIDCIREREKLITYKNPRASLCNRGRNFRK
ncbi:hypothetical protein GIB67_000408, partial [Kingdonia uniflora]